MGVRMKAERVCAMMIEKVPRDVRDQFKALCARKGVTMQSAVIALMLGAVKKGELPNQ